MQLSLFEYFGHNENGFITYEEMLKRNVYDYLAGLAL